MTVISTVLKMPQMLCAVQNFMGELYGKSEVLRQFWPSSKYFNIK